MPQNILIGTSGWIYPDWSENFYPSAIHNKLAYYVKYFNTVEVNYTYYQIPKEKIVASWNEITPSNFNFSVKLNTYFTHIKRLKMDKETKERLFSFFETLSILGKKFNALLIQLPPSEKFNSEKFSTFLQTLKQKLDTNKLTVAVEPRHDSWFCDEYYSLVKQFDCTPVTAVYPTTQPPSDAAPTAQTRYVRFHAKGNMFDYSDESLQKWAKYFKHLSSNTKRELLIYFNNDKKARSVVNAIELKTLLELQ